ncbi:MAG: DUF4943 family protein [Mangrovibacterium sp.]
MKPFLFFTCLGVILSILTFCQKNEFDIKNPNVDEFVRLVKDGNYFDKGGYELLDFTFSHIDRLIFYLNDTASVKTFPSNPLSSKYTNPKILNECIMWTIDGIRLENKYPSLEPCLINTSVYSESTGYSRLSGKELLELSEVYMNWYSEYKKNPSEQLKIRNLLENTTYKWN